MRFVEAFRGEFTDNELSRGANIIRDVTLIGCEPLHHHHQWAGLSYCFKLFIV